MPLTRVTVRPIRRFSGSELTSAFGVTMLHAAVAEWTERLGHIVNRGLLQLPDADSRATQLDGHVAGAVVEVTFPAAGVQVTLDHGLGYAVRNWVPCDPQQPLVFARTGGYSEQGIPVTSWPLRDGNGAALATYPAVVRFLVWGARSEQESR